jgi:hypothetical protein
MHTTRDITETLAQLQQAALQLAIGFERAQNYPHSEVGDALREASYALIEMRRTTDDLGHRLRSAR